MKRRIKLNEGTLAKIVKNAVIMAVNEVKKPNDVQHGIHKFKGVRYDTNGNPIYTHEGNTLSPDELRQMGWRISRKHGLCGQISDPTHLYSTNESIDRKIKKVRLTEGDLRKIVNRSVRKVMMEAVRYKPWYEFIGIEHPELEPIDCEFNSMYGEKYLICENQEDGELYFCREKTKTRQRVSAVPMDTNDPIKFMQFAAIYVHMRGFLDRDSIKVLIRSVVNYLGKPELLDAFAEHWNTKDFPIN